MEALDMGVVLSDSAREDLKKGLVDGLKRAFQADPGQTLTGQPVPEFLAGPPPADPFGKFQHEAGRAICDRWARGARPQILPGREGYYRKLCTPYLGGNGPSDPEFGPPYTGGRCAANYRIIWSAISRTTGQRVETNVSGFTLLGPVGNIVSIGSCSVNNTTPETNQRCTVVVARGSGQTQTFNNVPGSIINGLNTIKIERVIRTDALPDNCGNNPDEFDYGDRETTPDPNPGPIGGPPGFPFPNTDITVNPDGTINVDFGDGEPPSVIDPGNNDDDGGGGVVPPVAPTTPGTPGTPGDTGAGGESSGDEDDGRELTGVLVEVLSAPAGANKFDNIPVTVYRGVGYVAMGYPGLLGVDTSAAVVESPQFFHAQQRGLTAWRVRANVGFNLRTTPYYRETE